MNKRKIALGPGASSMILISVVLALCVLAVLGMVSARNAEGLGERAVVTTEKDHRLMAKGEATLAALDAIAAEGRKNHENEEDYLAYVEENLPEGMTMDGDRITWTEREGTVPETGENGEMTLFCGVRVHPLSDNTQRISWTRHVLRMVFPDEGEAFGDEWDAAWTEDAE